MRNARSIMDSCILNIRQHPQYACAASLLDTTCHYLQPSPIVEIRQLPNTPAQLLASTNLVMHAALIDRATSLELNSYQDVDGNQQPYLTGSVVSPTYTVHAEGGAEVRVFLFPEIKVWVAGSYKLRFSLFEESSEGMRLCHVALSTSFAVYQSNIYPGSFPPTPLDVTLASQNVRQRIFRQPFIRRPKLPSPARPACEKEGGLPRPPQLFKIQAKGNSARRRYATSTPASRCFTGRDAGDNEDKSRLAGPRHSRSSDHRLSTTPFVDARVAPVIANSRLGSILASVADVTEDSEMPDTQVDAHLPPKLSNADGGNDRGKAEGPDMTCTVTSQPTPTPIEPNAKPKSSSHGKMSLRNLLS